MSPFFFMDHPPDIGKTGHVNLRTFPWKRKDSRKITISVSIDRRRVPSFDQRIKGEEVNFSCNAVFFSKIKQTSFRTKKADSNFSRKNTENHLLVEGISSLESCCRDEEEARETNGRIFTIFSRNSSDEKDIADI